ncbi:MAG: amidohydrolase [Sphingobium sp.]|nr:amidohydrolase [Sphingobium sp.]
MRHVRRITARLLLGATLGLGLLGGAHAATAPRAAGKSATDAAVDKAVDAQMPDLMALYRDLHANPELSFQEVRTSAKLAEIARKLGFEVTEKVGQTGVVAVMKNGPGPVLLIRADMDALPLEEKTGLPFASKVRSTTRDGIESPVMHACGHDTHMTGWIGTARTLAAMKDKWSGTLVMILQPAEEIGLGAKAMLDDGLYTRFPKPNYAIAFHDMPDQASGVIALTSSWAAANVDSVDVTVRGVGGHGAYPQKTIDPIVLGSRIVTTLQTLISRENDPQTPAVVTVGSFVGGTKHNIIPDQAKLLITIRSFSDEVRARLLDGIKRVARGEAIAAGVPEDRMPIVSIEPNYTPSTYNAPELGDRLLHLFGAHFGADRAVKGGPTMAGEDFSLYWRTDHSVQSFIFFVGAVPADRLAAIRAGKAPDIPLHSPLWAPDADAVISTGAKALSIAALDILKKH